MALHSCNNDFPPACSVGKPKGAEFVGALKDLGFKLDIVSHRHLLEGTYEAYSITYETHDFKEIATELSVKLYGYQAVTFYNNGESTLKSL